LVERNQSRELAYLQSPAGEIGIGATAPAAALDVKGTVDAATRFNLGSPFAFDTLSK
jgi:hypothetical protein